MKKRIISFAVILAAILISTVGCVSEKTNEETTSLDTQISTETTFISDSTEPSAEQKYFEYSEVEGGYSYNLYDKDGAIVEKIDCCEALPVHELIADKLSKVTVGNETYYYDHDTKAFSEIFLNVFDENGSLLICCDGNKIIVCDIFNEDGFYKEFSDFTYGISEDSPFVSCTFIDGGGSIKVIYNTESGEERLECFNITNGTRCVIIEDWKNKKELMSGADKDSIKAFLVSYMGTYDYNTGFQLTYEVSGSVTINGEVYYHCECFYVMVEDDGTEKLVSCAEFVLSEGHDKRYDCRDKDGELIVYTENNMI